MVQYRQTMVGRTPPSTGLNNKGSVNSGGGGVYLQGSSSSRISLSDNASADEELERVIGAADMGADAAKMALDKVVTIDFLER